MRDNYNINDDIVDNAKDKVEDNIKEYNNQTDQGGILVFTSCHPIFLTNHFARNSVIREANFENFL